ncbi:hypothetical protein F4811DRAFT_305195 [Daldinia bambusicola]|nr:hypothetical protein F4811DRAFT_305195 [Daldinia bambusicola]
MLHAHHPDKEILWGLFSFFFLLFCRLYSYHLQYLNTHIHHVSYLTYLIFLCLPFYLPLTYHYIILHTFSLHISIHATSTCPCNTWPTSSFLSPFVAAWKLDGIVAPNNTESHP